MSRYQTFVVVPTHLYDIVATHVILVLIQTISQIIIENIYIIENLIIKLVQS